jgi:flagella basal body P-ring formation protein FlgA
MVGLGALVSIGVLPLPLWAGVTVRLAPEAEVRTAEISLGDVATIEGDEGLARRLRQVRLGPAPMPGGSARIDGHYLRLRLSEPQLEPQRVEIVAPDQILVTRAFQVLPGTAVVEAAAHRLQERLEALAPAGGPYAVVALSRQADLRVPTGAVELVAQVQGEPSLLATPGATVTVKVDGHSYQTIPLSFRVGRYGSAVVAARALEPRAVLGPGDWQVERRPSTEIPAGALSGIADEADLEAVRPIKAGEVLTSSLVRPRILVRRGELVTLVLEGPGFRITTQGVAVTDARRGDALRVLNQASKRETLGKVDAAGIVRVPFREPGSGQ